jgi:hypothetical protein
MRYESDEKGESLKARPRARLYERLLGESWNEVDEPVRRLHERGSGTCGEGLFAVRRGGHAFARALARLFGLPSEGESVRVCLSVTHADDGATERWHRTFEGRSFDTSQREGDGRMLAERAGPIELLFTLSEEGGALIYKQAGAALRLGPLRLTLPRSLAPRVEARECGADDGESVNVYVSSSAPLVGLMLTYEGLLSVKADEVTTTDEVLTEVDEI